MAAFWSASLRGPTLRPWLFWAPPCLRGRVCHSDIGEPMAPLCFSPRLRGELWRFSDPGDYARCRRIAAIPTPTPIFKLLLQTKALSPIDAWVILAWPLGDPSVTQSQSQLAEGSQAFPSTKNQLPSTVCWLIANCYLPAAKSSKTNTAFQP